jgi:hypothetical protein
MSRIVILILHDTAIGIDSPPSEAEHFYPFFVECVERDTADRTAGVCNKPLRKLVPQAAARALDIGILDQQSRFISQFVVHGITLTGKGDSMLHYLGNLRKTNYLRKEWNEYQSEYQLISRRSFI